MDALTGAVPGTLEVIYIQQKQWWAIKAVEIHRDFIKINIYWYMST